METPSHLKFLNPDTLFAPPGFSHVVEVNKGKLIYIAGQVSADVSFTVVGKGDFQAQAVQVFENLKAALAAAGSDFSHVIKLNYYLLDMRNLPALKEVRDRYVNTQHPPASTAVQISRLAHEDFLLEIEAIASTPL